MELMEKYRGRGTFALQMIYAHYCHRSGERTLHILSLSRPKKKRLQQHEAMLQLVLFLIGVA